MVIARHIEELRQPVIICLLMGTTIFMKAVFGAGVTLLSHTPPLYYNPAYTRNTGEES